ncbi:MAG: hypothetical protein ABI887_12435 [Burkholderiales bacterium]
MSKSVVLALVASATLLAAGGAQAGDHVSWSVGINLPVPRLVLPLPPLPPLPVIVSAPQRYYEPAPVYAPAPVYSQVPVYAQEPVYAPEPVYYQQRQRVYVRPVPVAYPRYYQPGWHQQYGHDRRDHHDRDDRRDGRPGPAWSRN